MARATAERMARQDEEHPYWDCPDWPWCTRFPCRVYREGWLAGYQQGKAEAAAEAYVSGYESGFNAGVAAAGTRA